MDQQQNESGTARSELRAAADEVRSGAREAAKVGRERGRSFVEHRKDAAATRLEGVAQALRDTARKLDEEGRESDVPDLVERAAGGIERVSASLRDRDVDGLVHDLEDFARRSPALYLGGAAAGGFLLARFLKSSTSRKREEPDRSGALGRERDRDLLPSAAPRSTPTVGATGGPRPFGSGLPPSRPHGDAGSTTPSTPSTPPNANPWES